MVKYAKNVINTEVSLSKRSEDDKITTFDVKELGVKAPQGSTWIFFLDGVTLEGVSNRKDGTTIVVKTENFPKYVRSPQLGRKTALLVIAIQRKY